MGKFKEEIRDLNGQLEELRETERLYENEELMIDHDIQDIGFFIPFM